MLSARTTGHAMRLKKRHVRCEIPKDMVSRPALGETQEQYIWSRGTGHMSFSRRICCFFDDPHCFFFSFTAWPIETASLCVCSISWNGNLHKLTHYIHRLGSVAQVLANWAKRTLSTLRYPRFMVTSHMPDSAAVSLPAAHC